MAVAFDAAMTAGNGAGGTYAEIAGSGTGTSLDSTGMTIGSGATLLVAVASWDSGANTPSATWNGVAMTLGPSIQVAGTVVTAIFTLVNPTTGNHTLHMAWTIAAQIYMSCVSFKGTDTATGIKTADSTTASNSTGITIASDVNGATVAIWADDTATVGSPNFTTIFTATDLVQNSAASYTLGGTSNAHTFTSPAQTDSALAGVHVIAPASTTIVFEDDSFLQFQPLPVDPIISVW